MSYESMCDVHDVAVYLRVASSGAQMGIAYTPADQNRTLRGNMQDLGADEITKYHARGMKVSHEFYATSNPSLTVDNLLLFEGSYMRVRGVYTDTDITGVPQVWIVPCDEETSRDDWQQG